MSSRNLFLLRHAQTAERLGNQSDFDRELTSVGLQNATRMGINLLNKNVQFDLIVSSPAKRALQTSGLLAEQLKYDTSNIFENKSIYEASVRNLLDIVNHFKDEWEHLLLVGHNPAISYLAEYLTGEEIGALPTCGLVHIRFDSANWELASQGTGNLVSFEYPELLNF